MRLKPFIVIFFSSISLLGQDSEALAVFERHYQQAIKYNMVSLYAESIDEINAALYIAREQEWRKKECELIIYLAEIKRKTKDNQEGLALLYKFKNSIQYSRLHVKKLGRIAALFNQMEDVKDTIAYRDSVLFYLDSALKIAIKSNLKSEQAGLYNELGYTLGAINIDSSLFYLNKAAQLFNSIPDTPNYVVTQTNIIRTYTLLEEYHKVEPIVDEVLQLLKSGTWNSLEVKLEFYRTLTYYYDKIGDSVKYNVWNLEKYKSLVKALKIESSSKLNSYRVLYEIKKYQDQADAGAVQLLKEKARTRELIFYFSILIIFFVIIAFLLFRERKLKRKLKQANNRYHMLLEESNHRIKNNLQMITSMLEHASKDIKAKESYAYKRISGKIQTISALHKHLCLDVHNERVNLNTYFNEIINLYENILYSSIPIQQDTVDVEIQSERIVYFGLIFNEMLSNTFEHSNAKQKGIYIEVKVYKKGYRLIYQDNSSFEVNQSLGSGIKLISQLVKRIEGFNFKVEGKTGKYQLEFYD